VAGAIAITINVAEVASDELREAFARLLPQLSATAPHFGAAALRELIAAPGTTLLLARGDGGRIVGMVTLVVFRTPTGVRAHIESLVVDQAVRGRGAGEALCRAALAHAEEAGADTVDLTSAPARAAANRLYRRLGFQRRDTNVYRHVVARRSSN
jgi:ribosomal protein S18 acetylase RimI-like enzyme